ncbi:MAG: hypothetical protein M1379_03860 [Firmicutes bacterium]|nr:hypothetical protein [Bacillota bacterium]
MGNNEQNIKNAQLVIFRMYQALAETLEPLDSIGQQESPTDEELMMVLYVHKLICALDPLMKRESVDEINIQDGQLLSESLKMFADEILPALFEFFRKTP